MNISEIEGQTFASVVVNGAKDKILFTGIGGRVFKMYHEQNCCEDVSIEDIVGDLDDLVGVPIVSATEETNRDEPKTGGYYDDSHTWTFYHIRTHKGTVTLRWYGESNGYYSEDVDFVEVTS